MEGKLSLSKRGGHRPGSGRKPNPVAAKNAEPVSSKWGGARPGAGRKCKPRRAISAAELLTFVHKIISAVDLGMLFDQARAGDLAAIQKLHLLFTEAEEAAQAALAEVVVADLFTPAIDQPEQAR
jgi:hypothetical protein